MLRIDSLRAGYGATPILFGVSLEVREGEAVALLGRPGDARGALGEELAPGGGQPLAG